MIEVLIGLLVAVTAAFAVYYVYSQVDIATLRDSYRRADDGWQRCINGVYEASFYLHLCDLTMRRFNITEFHEDDIKEACELCSKKHNSESQSEAEQKPVSDSVELRDTTPEAHSSTEAVHVTDQVIANLD